MNIVVTGGAGFIGSHFVRQLRERCGKCGIFVIDRLTYAGDVKRIRDIKDIDFFKLDICDFRKLRLFFSQHKVQSIVNFAAHTHVDRSIKDDTPFIESNIRGTHNLLRIVLDGKVRNFFHISTDEVYGDLERNQINSRFTEDSNIRPNSPYAASKASADLLIRSYTRTYGIPAVIIRPSNNYGPWQHCEKFIPTVICNALLGRKVPVYAKGHNRREWLYVVDCAQAILEIVLVGKLKHNVYNIGSGFRPRNIDIARKILKILNKPVSLIKHVQDRPGHDFMYALKSTRLRNELGWNPRISLDAGLERTALWYKEHRGWWGTLYR